MTQTPNKHGAGVANVIAGTVHYKLNDNFGAVKEIWCTVDAKANTPLISNLSITLRAVQGLLGEEEYGDKLSQIDVFSHDELVREVDSESIKSKKRDSHI